MVNNVIVFSILPNMVAVSYYWNIWQMHELERRDVTPARINPGPEMKGRNWFNEAYWEYLNIKFNEIERCFSKIKWISQKHLSNCRILNIKSYVTALKMDAAFYLENLPMIHYSNKRTTWCTLHCGLKRKSFVSKSIALVQKRCAGSRRTGELICFVFTSQRGIG